MNSERNFAEEIQRFVKILEKEKIETNKLEQKESKGKKIIDENLIPILKNITNVDDNEYLFKSSIGNGREYGKIPWIFICKQFMGGSHANYKKFINIRYLFTADLKGIYLSLNQGLYLKYNMLSNKKCKFCILSKFLKKNLKSIPEDMQTYSIDLKIGESIYSKNHQKSYILGKYYDIDNLPNDGVFADDFNKMIGIYKEALDLLKNETSLKDMSNTYNKLYIKYFLNGLNKVFCDCYKKTSNDSKDSQPKETTEKDKEFETKERKEVPKRTKVIIETYPRNEEFVKVILEENNYKCEVNKNHKTFINETTNKQYMEAHHLIPMKEYETYEKTGKCIDVLENMCCICPNCHRLLHHGLYTKKEKILKKLYTKKEILLKEAGLEISFDELKKYYEKIF